MISTVNIPQTKRLMLTTRSELKQHVSTQKSGTMPHCLIIKHIKTGKL